MDMNDLDIRSLFPPPAEEDWRAAAEKLLKGKPFRETLFSQTDEGLTLSPIYWPGGEPLRVMPGRGKRHWELAQTLYAGNDTFNRRAREALQNGQTALKPDLDVSSQWGSAPPHIPGRMGSIHLTEAAALDELLANIDPAKTPLYFDALNRPAEIAGVIKVFLEKRGCKNAGGGLGADPLSGALRYGGFPADWPMQAEGMQKAAEILRDFPEFDLVTIHADIIHNSGGHKVRQLAYFLSVAANYFRLLSRDAATDPPPGGWRLRLAVGNDQFAEIAKLRAARLLWRQLLRGFDLDEGTYPLSIDAVTSWRYMSFFDPWVNMIRATGQAFSAIVGGCDTLDILPFDLALGQPDAFSLRQARNISVILGEESYLGKVREPASGSAYLDSLTREMAGEAWRLFQHMEEQGGILSLIREGRWQKDIREEAAREEREYEEGRRKAIGSNVFPNPAEKRPTKAGPGVRVNILPGPAAEAVEPLPEKRVLADFEKRRLREETE
ncbi:MAG TPA: hypothetical protein ENJ10_11955 [Caldithrix abyssi]|uniref:Methylmalonyl-CoA mutase alpha/beta chain catalytic domain-containing protein n=1 Tax=Caldithrix abyssi TaxID=187145 RepID=A0A7V1LNZ1_CALAY|nr:hypothetical protein [Caldithrix abyssi]